ncbi:MAG: hypothetical protein JNL57_12515 [Bacteroidetes bacterium]|nr:hypothetical protein [Bacteroidota bacterium]
MDLRKKENLHVVFWLVKDFAWLADLQWLGVIMALPTFLLSCWLTWRCRNNRADFFHNIAITCWIMGNITWMCGEFFFDDTKRAWAVPFFILGFVFIGYFYVSAWLGKKRSVETNP